MVDRWFVFGGWAVDTALLKPIFGEESDFFDAGDIISPLVQNAVITGDWADHLAQRIKPLLPSGPYGIAGWSTGAMLAWAAAKRLRPSAVALLSATPSFCRRPGFSFGWRPSVLRSMREKLAADQAAVLRDFHIQCGLEPNSCPHTVDRSLADGLLFLEQVSLLPVEPLACPTLFLHGQEDVIVPVGSGELFCSQAGGTFATFEGPHAFFIGRENEVAATISEFA